MGVYTTIEQENISRSLHNSRVKKYFKKFTQLENKEKHILKLIASLEKTKENL